MNTVQRCVPHITFIIRLLDLPKGNTPTRLIENEILCILVTGQVMEFTNAPFRNPFRSVSLRFNEGRKLSRRYINYFKAIEFWNAWDVAFWFTRDSRTLCAYRLKASNENLASTRDPGCDCRDTTPILWFNFWSPLRIAVCTQQPTLPTRCCSFSDHFARGSILLR